MKTTGETKYLGSYINRLIVRAVNNRIFENNTKGDYRIEPQHGVNVWKYNLYKKNKFIATFSIALTMVSGEMENAEKREQKEILNTLRNLFPNKIIIMRDFYNN